MENNTENKGLNNIISLIISIIIVVGIGYVIYICFIHIGNIPGQNSAPNNTPVELSESQVNKMGVEKYNELYAKTSYSDNSFIFFKDEDVTIDNLSNQDKLYVLYSLLSDEDKNKTGNYDESCFLNKGVYTRVTYPDKCPKETFDKNILGEKLYGFFDNSMTVNYEDFFASSTNKCFITDSKYNCYLNTSNYSISNYTVFTKFDSAKKVDNTLEVYSYLLTVRKYAKNGHQKGVYSNATATNKIDDLKTDIGDTITEELTNKLINEYKDKITKYKSTFIISNDNYLWQKTEIVK